MTKNKRGLGYQGCTGCSVKVPEKECVSCWVPRREIIALPASPQAREEISSPTILGWGTVD